MKIIGIVLAVIAASLALAAPPEEPHGMTGGDLQKLCTDQDTASKSACRLYILGIAQGISLGMAIADGKTDGGRPCVPENLSGDALELVVKMKLGQDLMVFPADRELGAAGLVGGVLVNSFNCSKSRH